MQILGAATEATGQPALTNDEIIDTYGKVIDGLIACAADTYYDSERQFQLNQSRLQWMFVRGEHFNAPGFLVTPYGNISDYLPFDFSNETQETGASIKLCPPINCIGGDCWKFMAIMGQNAPRVKCTANDEQDPDEIQKAQDADINARDIWRKKKVDALWQTIAFHQYTTGPSFIRATWNADKGKYGATVEPKIDVKTDDTGLPIPVVSGTEEYPNGDVEVEIKSCLEVAVPWQAEALEQCDWLRCETLRSKWTLLEKYKGRNDQPGRLDQFRDGSPPDDGFTSATSLAFEVKDAVSTPSGTGRSTKPNEWRHAEYWLKPHLFQAISEPQIRQVFQDHFPHGIYISRVGNITVEIDDEDKCDVWVICHVGREPRIMARPICADGVPLQRAMNDLWGMSIETVLRAITQTIVDSQLFDRQAMSTNEAIPAEIIPTALPVDGDLSKRIYQIPPARLSDQVPVLIDRLRHVWQYDIIGITPELSGGGQPTQTYHEARQRRDQALQVLSPQAAKMREAAARTAEITVKMRAKYGTGQVKVPRKTAYGKGTDVSDMANLKCDGWHAEADDNFPMTLSDRRDAVYSMLKDFPPEVQQALGILNPMNIEVIFELLEVPGFESMLMEQVQKNLTDVQHLLAAQPVPDPQTGEPTASLPPDASENHVVASQVFSSWMVSKVGQDAKASNPQGYANVMLRWKAQQALANPIPPPPPPIKPSLAISMKAEDFPNLVPTIMTDSGVVMPPPATPPPGAPGIGAPPPVGPPPPPGAPPPSAGPASVPGPLAAPPNAGPPVPNHQPVM